MKLKKYLLLQLTLFAGLCLVVGCERSEEVSPNNSIPLQQNASPSLIR